MLSILTVVALLAAPAQRPADVVKWSVEPVAALTGGATVNVKVTAQVQPGWKLYALEQPAGGPKPLAFALATGSPFEVLARRIAGPKAKVQKQDANFAVDTHYYENEAVFTVPVSLSKTATAGVQEIPLEVTFQACGAELCLRPFTQKLPVKVANAR